MSDKSKYGVYHINSSNQVDDIASGLTPRKMGSSLDIARIIGAPVEAIRNWNPIDINQRTPEFYKYGGGGQYGQEPKTSILQQQMPNDVRHQQERYLKQRQNDIINLGTQTPPEAMAPLQSIVNRNYFPFDGGYDAGYGLAHETPKEVVMQDAIQQGLGMGKEIADKWDESGGMEGNWDMIMEIIQRNQ